MTIIIFVVWSSSVLSTNEDSITRIRILYQEVEKQIKNNELIETKMNLVANEVNNAEIPVDLVPIYKFYWSTETQNLVKVNIFVGRGSVYFDKEYLFYPKGDSAFVYEKTTNSKDNKILEERRYYFNNSKLLRYIEGENTIDKSFPSKIIESSKEKIKTAELLNDIFEKVWLISK